MSISLNDFNSLKETLYLLSTPKNASELMKSIAQLEASQTLTRGLIDNEQKENDDNDIVRVEHIIWRRVKNEYFSK